MTRSLRTPANLMRTLTSILGAATLILAASAPVQGQEVVTDLQVADLLRTYQQEMAAPPLYRSETGGLILEMITGRQIRITPAQRAALLNGLERIVMDRDALEDTRADAVGLLALAGERGLPAPAVGVVARLGSIYRRTDSELVQRQILLALPRAQERAGAIALLRTLVERPTESFPGESWEAIRGLQAAGPGGLTVLRRIHEEGSARNAAARSLVARYVESDFRLPRP
jgi:hypothetical protein